MMIALFFVPMKANDEQKRNGLIQQFLSCVVFVVFVNSAMHLSFLVDVPRSFSVKLSANFFISCFFHVFACSGRQNCVGLCHVGR